jgi:chromosome segregation ATPase
MSLELPTTLQSWLAVAVSVISLGTVGLGFVVRNLMRDFLSRNQFDEGIKDLKDKIEKLHSEDGALNKRVTAVEAKFDDVPSVKDFHDLRLTIEKLTGTVSTQLATLTADGRAVKHQLDIIQQTMIDSARDQVKQARAAEAGPMRRRGLA